MPCKVHDVVYNLHEMTSLILLCLMFMPCMLFRGRLNGAVPGTLDFGVTKYTKVILMLGVVVHHLSQNSAPPSPDLWGIGGMVHHLFCEHGAFFCAVFFFFSGYGLVYSAAKKPNYISSIPRRFYSILLPYLIANLVYGVLFFVNIKPLISGEPIQRQLYVFCAGVAKMELTGMTLVQYGWFIDQILLFYLLFYLCNKYLPPFKAVLIQAAVCVCLIFAMKAIGWGGWRYNSLLAFVFGQLYCRVVWRMDTGVSVVRSLAFLFIMPALIYGINAALSAGVPFRNSSGYSLATIPVALILSLFSTRPHKLTDHISAASFEVYMYQGVSFCLLASVFSQPLPKCTAVLAGALVLGLVMHAVNSKIVGYLETKRTVSNRGR